MDNEQFFQVPVMNDRPVEVFWEIIDFMKDYLIRAGGDISTALWEAHPFREDGKMLTVLYEVVNDGKGS
jgi:hypothetical protein